MGQSAKRHIGRILLDGRFLSQQDLDHALIEQTRTKELLGQVLVRMGVLSRTRPPSPFSAELGRAAFPRDTCL